MMWHSLASSMFILSVTCAVCVPVHSHGRTGKDRMTSQSSAQDPRTVISSSSSSSDVSLNERIANYIEQVRFLQAQNRKLENELEELRSTEGKRTDAMKDIFKAKLKKVQNQRDDFLKENNKLEVIVQSLRDQNAEHAREMTSQSSAQDPRTVISSSLSSSNVSVTERIANYIEKVRFLQAQNKKLVDELEELKSTEGKRTKALKDIFEAELQKVRGEGDDILKENYKLEVIVQSLRDQNSELFRETEKAKKWREEDNTMINTLNQKISDLESVAAMLHRTNDNLMKERQRDLALNADLIEQMEKFKIDLQNKAIQYQDSENRLQTITEEMKLMKSFHEQELKELQALAYRDTTDENREYWKNEMSQAVRDIQNEYESKVEQISKDMQTFYNEKTLTDGFP